MKMFNYLIRQPQPAATTPPVLLLFHGYGSNKEDLFGLSPYLDPRLLIVSVDAPCSMKAEGLPNGYAWFPLTFTPAGVEYDREEAKRSIERVLDFIRTIPQKFGGDPDRIFLLGFSQGAMMAHAVLLDAPKLIRGVAALSGRRSDELFEGGKEKEKLKGFPLFVSHGWYDDVLPIHNGRAIRDFYQKTPVALTYKEYPMGHEISAECLKDLQAWLKERIEGPTPASQ